MSLAVQILEVDMTQKKFRVRFQVTPSSSYTTGGDTLDWGTVTQISSGPSVPFGGNPTWVFIQSQPSASGAASGFFYSYSNGTFPNGLMQVWGQDPTSATTGVIALSELAQASYPAGVTGDTIIGMAEFDKLQP